MDQMNTKSKEMCAKFDMSHTNNDDSPKQVHVSVVPTEKPELPEEAFGYSSQLNVYRNQIDNINPDDWKKVRWYINDYDFLVKNPIINRAFYKYWEIINEFEIFENYKDKDLILHCAEAPGGFIQGTNIYLQIDRIIQNENEEEDLIDDDGFQVVKKKKRKHKKDYRIYTISMNKDLPQYKSYNLPSYNKSIINKHVCISYGKDNTGDINTWENLEYMRVLAKNNFYLITADGGFDEGTDFNNKEQLHYYLILSEIYAAIHLQKHGGHFILKVFEIFTNTSMNLMYLLSQCYREVYIYKPKTSRPTNSEKYVVCKDFMLDENIRKHYTSSLKQLYQEIKSVESKYMSFTLYESLPESFVSRMKWINMNLLDNQCAFLREAVNLCNDKDFLNNYDGKLQDCVKRRRSVFHEWEETYNLHAFV
jgi:23S rRNA U2552 (ribose-2'-O)-methylase RlmE/FtsJ